jgi:hypothetical protein
LSTSSADPVGTAIAAIVTGAATGGAFVCAVLIAAHDMPRGAETPFATIVLAGAAFGLALAVGTAGWIGRSLGAWRRIVAGMIAAAGTALVGVLTTVADIAAGRIGLGFLGALCLAAIVIVRRIFSAKDAA